MLSGAEYIELAKFISLEYPGKGIGRKLFDLCVNTDNIMNVRNYIYYCKFVRRKSKSIL